MQRSLPFSMIIISNKNTGNTTNTSLGFSRFQNFSISILIVNIPDEILEFTFFSTSFIVLQAVLDEQDENKEN